MIKNLIFDLDDTLVNDRENHKEAFKYILKFLKIDYTEELFQQWLDFDTFYWKDYFKTITVPAEYSKTGSDSAEYLRGLRFQLFFKTSNGAPHPRCTITSLPAFDRMPPLPVDRLFSF